MINSKRVLIHYITILFFIVLLVLSVFPFIDKNYNDVEVDLPEEYLSITYDVPLRGYYDNDGVLHIEFNNDIQFKWQGLEKDIPPDNSHIQVYGTIENTVYIGPIDE